MCIVLQDGVCWVSIEAFVTESHFLPTQVDLLTYQMSHTLKEFFVAGFFSFFFVCFLLSETENLDY